MTETAFVELVAEESGLPLALSDLRTGFDDLPGWDSVHLLKVLTALEAEQGRRLPMAKLLHASTLADLHAAVSP